MTEAEERELERDATTEALFIGGVLAVLLGVRRSASRISWDGARFIVDSRTVSITTIRRQLNRIETSLGGKLGRITDDLEAGRIRVDDWQRRMKSTVGGAHVLAGALGLGSIGEAVKDADVQSRVIAEKQYADDFADEVRKKKAGPRIKSRAKSYLMAAVITYSVVEQKVRGALGFIEARRVRRASESCSGCITWSGRWIPINNMPRIGSLNCGGRCRCYLIYR